MEFALLAPWYVFIFIGIFDWGFFAHGLISTENAARVAAVYLAQQNTPTDQAAAFNYALTEMQTSVNGSGMSNCNCLPLIVTAAKVTGPDNADAVQVTVEYQVQQLIPIPGILPATFTFYRMAEMKI